MSGAEIDRLGEPSIFVVLRRGEIVRVVLEQRGRVGHAGIEPRGVEIIADIVMRVDVLSRASFGVAVKPVPQVLQHADQRLVAEQRLDQIVVDAEQIEELGQVRRVPFAPQIAFRDADVAAFGEAPCETVAVDGHGSGGAGLGAAAADHAAVRQRHVQRAAPQPCREAECQTDKTGEVRHPLFDGVRGKNDDFRHDAGPSA